MQAGAGERVQGPADGTGAAPSAVQVVQRQPSGLLVRAVGAVAAAVPSAAGEGTRAWAGAADPGLRAQRGAAAEEGPAVDAAVREVQPPSGLAAAVGALGTGLRGGGGSRRNGFTAERRQLTEESAGRGVLANRAGVRARPEPRAARSPRHRRQAPGGHPRCPKHTETGLVRAKYVKFPRGPDLSGDLDALTVVGANAILVLRC